MGRGRSYSELIELDSFQERFDYLSLGGMVADETFGTERWINQQFYRSREWRDVRDEVLIRDGSCDLGIPGLEVHRNAHIHHMNPMTARNIVHGDRDILDPEFLITTSFRTHNAIHYGDASQLFQGVVERSPGDTRGY